ncbi:hypothetical protein NDU88_005410 [Pleurodeles waltl]|uniref:Uncharacterized protein n=1 Tax=Pleurodeles waltl TaxID=8319 RepID=A0AAV7SLJ1_PLEWA|nr:hypothetical protein NDU88_005410 [Pleurodeles waltl]
MCFCRMWAAGAELRSAGSCGLKGRRCLDLQAGLLVSWAALRTCLVAPAARASASKPFRGEDPLGFARVAKELQEECPLLRGPPGPLIEVSGIPRVRGKLGGDGCASAQALENDTPPKERQGKRLKRERSPAPWTALRAPDQVGPTAKYHRGVKRPDRTGIKSPGPLLDRAAVTQSIHTHQHQPWAQQPGRSGGGSAAGTPCP